MRSRRPAARPDGADTVAPSKHVPFFTVHAAHMQIGRRQALTVAEENDSAFVEEVIGGQRDDAGRGSHDRRPGQGRDVDTRVGARRSAFTRTRDQNPLGAPSDC